MPATIAGSHLGPDIHANRPAANTAGQPIGALYSCTTHSLIYKTDGSTWSTYATLGSGATPPGTELDYGQITTTAPITATGGTSTADTNLVVAAAGFTSDGTPVMIVFDAAYWEAAAGTNTRLWLYEGTTQLGLFALQTPSAVLGRLPIHRERKITPSAGSRTYSIRGSTDAGTSNVGAGAGGTTNVMPAYIRVTKA